MARRRPGAPNDGRDDRMTWRRPVDDVPVAWRTTRAGRLGKPKTKDRHGAIKNLSPIGAGVVVDTDDRDRVGEVVEISIGGVWNPARIARIVAHPEQPISYLGLEFVTVRHDFLIALNELLDQADHTGAPGADLAEDDADSFWGGEERREVPVTAPAVRLPPFLDRARVRRLPGDATTPSSPAAS